MNSGLCRRRGWLSRAAKWCLGMGPRQGQATDLLRQLDPGSAALGLCDGESLAHDTILVQDVSRSMSWKDYPPSRLKASTLAAETFIRKRASLSPGDRIAIVTFNIRGRIVLPLTEIAQLDLIIMRLATLTGTGGTDIAEGLKAANAVFAQDVAQNGTLARYRRIILQTDGQGGRPLGWAMHLKNAGVLLEVIGVGGDPRDVDERLLRKVATTDTDGRIRYRFIGDSERLVAQYENLASGLLYRGPSQ